MKILITGANGQLGYDLCRVLESRRADYIGTDIADFDITSYPAAEAFLLSRCPDVVIHCAAYTDVERAEDEQEECHRVNAGGTEVIARICEQIGATMVYISTDYVFSGLVGENPHEVNEPVSPLNQYGRGKAEGEAAVLASLNKYFIVRSSWIFGVNGKNFVKTMLRLGQERNTLSVVCDQVGSPTYTVDLAEWLCDLIQTDKYGVYHATNEGFCSFADFAEKIFELAGLSVKVNRITSDCYPSKVKRPLNSRLSKASVDANGLKRLPHWEDALERYLAEGKF